MTQMWIGLGAGFLANVLIEIFLWRLGTSTPVQRSVWKVLIRWVSIFASLLFLAFFSLDLPKLVFVGLFAVSAGCDFETTYLPPDVFLYGCTALNIAWSAWAGPEAFRGVLVAQVLCFGLAVFLTYTGAWNGGDIKLLMQYGAAAGGIGLVATGFVIEQVLRVAFIAVIFCLLLSRHRSGTAAWSETKRASIGPHGGVAYVGLIGALLIQLGGLI